MRRAKRNRGFIALISGVLITAILIPLAVSAGRAGWFARMDVLSELNTTVARALSQSCVAMALLALATSSDPEAYTVHNQLLGVDTRHSCTITEITHNGEEATISTFASMGDSYVSSIAVASISPQIQLLSLQDSP
ncbi:MAG TPA: hypothetical protein VMU27_03385 [Candidatus Paceibacterota bacterium]|nr:hypothetical protein [Candidatus Paceibacterota bacterium]